MSGRRRTSPSQSPDIDAGWAWVIAGAGLAASAISSGKILDDIFSRIKI